MTRKELLNLMQFVVDQNNTTLVDVINTLRIDCDDKQKRALAQAVEAKTKDCFLRFIEKI